MNEFFSKKIKKIREEFPDVNVDTIEILGKLIKKPVKKFSMPLITYEETYSIISKMKLSGASGMDDITTKFTKQVPQLTALYM